MNQIVAGAFLLTVIVGMMILGLILHTHYFIRVMGHVKKSDPDRLLFRKQIVTALHIRQGSNFNIVMLFSWSIFLVAIAFLYFMTPDILGAWNYFKVPLVASESFGLFYFGGAVIIISGLLVAPFIPQCYGYYQISKELKQMTLLTPVFLLASILCSVYLGTIYPETDPFYWYLGYLTLLISLTLMLMPIAKGWIEEMRT